jgi:hypothetical protein
MRASVLEPLYDQVLDGFPFLGTPADSAQRFGRASANGDDLVAWYVGLSGATGFVCGLPGLLMTPVTLPANVVGVAMLQLHLAAALAVRGGHDVHARAVRARCIHCLLEKPEGASSTEEEEVAGRVGIKMVERGLRLVADAATTMAARSALRAAGRHAMRRLSQRGLPLVGGLIGGLSDGYATAYVGQRAQRAFLRQPFEG